MSVTISWSGFEKAEWDGRANLGAKGHGALKIQFGPGVHDYFTTRIDNVTLACCGCKTMTYMDWMGRYELCNKEFLEKLISFLLKIFAGGNIAFVLNKPQKEHYKPMLKLMEEYGPVKYIKFYNHNMGNDNFMYVWTFNGKGEEE